MRVGMGCGATHCDDRKIGLTEAGDKTVRVFYGSI